MRTGSLDVRLERALHRLAAEGPSDRGLLAMVHAASARATARRRALAGSVAVLTVVGVAVAASARDSRGPSGAELIIGDPEQTAAPTPDPVVS